MDTLTRSMWGPLAGQVDEWLEAQLGGVSRAEGTVTSAISSIEAELAEIAAREEQERREAEEEARREAEEQTDVPPGMFE